MKTEKSQFNVGDFVYYVEPFKTEYGRIKSLCDDPNFVFVVYNCNEDWDNYQNYTGARTNIKSLHKELTTS
jgi:hypothetical protein